MAYLRSFSRTYFPLLSSTSTRMKVERVIGIIALLFATLPIYAQDQPQPAEPPAPNSSQTDSASNTVTIPAGTRMALVLTQPVQTRYVRRGDDIYAQVTSPVDADNEVVIPPGTFVQGTVDKIQRTGGRGELRLQSMSLTFPDGYVTPIAGPIVLETTDGYAIKDPGSKRGASAFVLPLAGAGLGALIGHSVGTSDSTVTSNFPPGCSPPQFGCITTSTPVFGSKGKDTAIGASIGSVAGVIASITLLVSSRHFYLDAGAPVQMTLQRPVTLRQDEVAKAVRQSQEWPVAVRAVEPRPMPPPPPDTPIDRGTCYTPGTPGTPPTVIPGAPGPDGIPGPPTIIPGTPPTPGTPYPCP
ncbi:MAG TPA: hypothetical protein VE377_20465 [Candidatus Dormibacteraeota bacterium]|nr:hypothetical protein [Candidatus Dormibacteraeota bacterium]